MALPATLPTASFADLLKVSDTALVQVTQSQSSRTAGGKSIYATRGDGYYRAEVTSGPVPHAEAEGIMALINSRAAGTKSILLHNFKLPYPASDPEGLIIGATVPKLGAVADRLHVAFTGFPVDYVMLLGTYFSIQISGRYYLGQFCEPRTANGSGAIASVEIWPPLPPWVTGAPDVVLKKAPGEFTIVPNSAYPSIMGALHTTIKFTAEQDL